MSVVPEEQAELTEFEVRQLVTGYDAGFVATDGYVVRHDHCLPTK